MTGSGLSMERTGTVEGLDTPLTVGLSIRVWYRAGMRTLGVLAICRANIPGGTEKSSPPKTLPVLTLY